MRIGIFVTAAFTESRFIDAISGHVQIPLMTAKLLAEAGYNVTLVTTKPKDSYVLPKEISAKVSIRIIEHASKLWPERGIEKRKLLKQMFQLLSFFRKDSFDIIHFFGSTNVGLALSFLKYLGATSSAFFTPIKPLPADISGLKRKAARLLAFRRIDKVVASTDYVRDNWGLLLGQSKVATLYPGPMKEVPVEPEYRSCDSVLFWRNADYKNGADLAMDAFAKLAPNYPNIRFVFSVRPNDVLEDDLLNLKNNVPNIEVYIYPYKDGITIASLMKKSLFVVQPFRSLSINPQMSILETLYSGTPVIASNIESNPELIQDNENGLLIPPDDKNALAGAIEKLLNNSELLEKMTRTVNVKTRLKWNWKTYKKGLFEEYNIV